ncbi:MAG: HAD family hydrolase [Angelakisella sp.]
MVLQAPVKGIFFDLGWTLLYPASGDWMLTHKVMELLDQQALKELPRERLIAATHAALGTFRNDVVYLTEAEELERNVEFYSTFARLLPELSVTPAAVMEMANDRVYNTKHNYILFPDTIATLQALRGQYKLGIISDTDPSVLAYLANTGLGEYFDCVTYSFAVGAIKPDAKLYTHALAAMGLPPQQTVFIDDLSRNLDGAARHGIQGVQAATHADSPLDSRYHSIQSPGGLLQLL